MPSPKTIFYGVISVILAILAVIGLKYVQSLKSENTRLFTELIGQKQAYEQLSAHAAKLEIDYQNQVDLRAAAEKTFANEKSAMEAHIKILSDATYLIKEKARESGSSDVVFNGPNSQYVLNELRLGPTDDGKPGPAVGYVLIFKDGRVVSKVYNHEIDVYTLVSKDEMSGKYSVISKADYVLKSPSLNPSGQSWLNQHYPLNIVGGKALIDPTEPLLSKKTFYFWDPKINLNANLDPNGIYPGLGVSIMGFGASKNDLDWKFIQLGAEVKDKTFYPTLTPIMWRPFSSLIDNTYIGPGLSLTPDGIKYFLGIQVGL